MKIISIYFSAVKNNFKTEWNNPKEHKIFSVASMNGFLLSLKKSFKEIGVQDFDYYNDKIKNLDIGHFHYSGY